MADKSVLLGSVCDPPPDPRVAAIAGGQHGLITVRQLLGAGLDRSAVAKRVHGGRLHRIGRAVYAVGHASLSQEGRWLAAVLEAGEGAALSHLAAAKLWEIWRRRSTRIDVVGPCRSRLPYVHGARRLDARAVTRHKGIPVTTVARTLVDLIDVLTAEQPANVIHEAAFKQRFSERATPGGHRALTRAPESEPARESCGHAHRRQRRHEERPEDTRVEGLEVDFCWPALKLCAETGGSGHARPRTRREDAERDARLNAAGYRVVRIPG